MPRLLAAALLLAAAADTAAGARRVLYLTATAGFRHGDAIETSVEVMQSLAPGVLEIVHTEDLASISAENLRSFDAVYFFTSGELPFSDQQKADLLSFVRQGKGFGGSHSATDTLYAWPEYGEMIGAYFDGHPWTQEAAVDVEDPGSPIVAHMSPGFRVMEELYQFRSLSRDQVRVLLTLDTRSVDLNAPGVNRTDSDFPLAWMRKFGEGRVFYSAFGHFPASFQHPGLREMLKNALQWLTGEIEADATPRSGPSALPPAIAGDGVRNLHGASDRLAPGSVVTIAGERLTSGSTLFAASTPLPVRLAGTHVEVNGIPAPLFSVSPDSVLAQLPLGLVPGQPTELTVASVNRASQAIPLRIEPAAPEIVAATRAGDVVVVYVLGLGATEPAVSEGIAAPAGPLARTLLQPVVRLEGQPAVVEFSGLAPGLVGVYQVNAALPAGTGASAGALEIAIEAAGGSSTFVPAP